MNVTKASITADDSKSGDKQQNEHAETRVTCRRDPTCQTIFNTPQDGIPNLILSSTNISKMFRLQRFLHEILCVLVALTATLCEVHCFLSHNTQDGKFNDLPVNDSHHG